MTRYVLTIAVSLLGAATFAQDTSEDLKKLQGKSEMVKRVWDGETVKLERTIWIINGNTIRYSEEPDATTAKLTLDPTKKPKTLEVQTILPDGDGAKGFGIYAIEG